MARPGRAIRFTGRAIFDTNANSEGISLMDVWRNNRSTYIPARTFKSLGSGALTPPSKGGWSECGGSGSRPRGRMPGSVKAYKLQISPDQSPAVTKAPHSSQHARDGQQGHIRRNDRNSDALVFPPPHGSRTEVDASDSEHHGH